MRPSLLLSLLIYLLVLGGLATVNGALLVLAVPLVLYLGAGLLFGPGDVHLELERSIDVERVTQGKPVEVRLRVTNRGGHIEQLWLQDKLPPGLERLDGETSLLAELPAGAHLELRYRVQGGRGFYRFVNVQSTLSDRLGIMRWSQELPAPGRIFVLPEMTRLKHVAIRPLQTVGYSGIIPARQGGAGVEFLGVRAYQAGDPLRRINWLASARHRQALFSNEFEQERGANVGLILDARIRSDIDTSQGSIFEHAVTATASLAQALLNDGNRVGLLVYGGYLAWTYPGFGKIQRERILRALVRASPGASQVFDKLEKLPTRIFPAHSQLILVSTLHHDDLPVLIRLRARGYQVMVVSPDPVAFEVQILGSRPAAELGIRLARLEREVLIKRLQRAGVQVLSWDVSQPFDQAMRLALSRIPPWVRPIHI